MSSRTPLRHPEEEELLRLADGELPPRRAAEVRAHLEACWQCRAAMEEMQSLVGECVRYRRHVLVGCMPPPPAPWADIERGFDAIDAQREPLRTRVARWLGLPFRGAARWAPVAVALALTGVLLYELRETPSVQAAALLRKAVAAEESHPRTARRVRIRTAKRQVTRVLGAQSKAIPVSDDDRSIEALFLAAHYDWNDPLSARSYQAWRDQAASPRDEVAAGDDIYRIKTSTDSGELASATLTLRTRDLQPLESRLEFRNREWVEIEELPAEAAPAPQPVAAVPAAPPSEPARATEPAPFSVTAAHELQVVAALHQLGADLGDPVEVSRSGGRVVVSGVGIAPERQQQIASALGRMPGVDVRFSEPAAAQAAQPAAEMPAAPVAGSGFPSRIEKQLGGRPQFDRLATRLLDTSETIMARAYAMRRLARQFPREVEAQLSTADRAVLSKLNQEHAAVLSDEAAGLDRLVSQILISLGASAGSARPGVPVPASWQDANEELFRTARSVETGMAQILGVAAGEPPSAQLPAELLSGVARLRAQAGICRRAAAENDR
jgi:hypothetical protein